MSSAPRDAIILAGGVAKGAFTARALEALFDPRQNPEPPRLRRIVAASSGGLNAAYLAHAIRRGEGHAAGVALSVLWIEHAPVRYALGARDVSRLYVISTSPKVARPSSVDMRGAGLLAHFADIFINERYLELHVMRRSPRDAQRSCGRHREARRIMAASKRRAASARQRLARLHELRDPRAQRLDAAARCGNLHDARGMKTFMVAGPDRHHSFVELAEVGPRQANGFTAFAQSRNGERSRPGEDANAPEVSVFLVRREQHQGLHPRRIRPRRARGSETISLHGPHKEERKSSRLAERAEASPAPSGEQAAEERP